MSRETNVQPIFFKAGIKHLLLKTKAISEQSADTFTSIHVLENVLYVASLTVGLALETSSREWNNN